MKKIEKKHQLYILLLGLITTNIAITEEPNAPGLLSRLFQGTVGPFIRYKANKALWDAIVHQDIKAIDAAIQAGANVNEQLGDISPIQNAAYIGNTDVLKALIDYGANVNDRDDEGETPLHHAILGANRNSDSNLGAIKLLIEAGADIEAKDKYGRTAFDKARAVSFFSDFLKSLENLKKN